MKTSLKPIVVAHYRSYRDARTGRVRWRDHLVFDGTPLLVIAACFIGDVHLKTTATAALLTVSGILSAFLFGVMLQVSQRAMDWADSGPEPSLPTTEHAEFLEEIAANAGYAALVSLAAAMLFVVATVTTKFPLEVFSALGLGVGAHTILVLFMVVKRVFAVTQERLRNASSGASVASVTHLHKHTGS